MTSIASLQTDSLAALRNAAARDPRAALKEAAKQFEGLFMQELMKSMRQASMSSGMLDNAGTQLGTEMLDSQMATKMTGLKGGLSEAIARQLERQMGFADEAKKGVPAINTTAKPAVSETETTVSASATLSAPEPAITLGTEAMVMATLELLKP